MNAMTIIIRISLSATCVPTFIIHSDFGFGNRTIYSICLPKRVQKIVIVANSTIYNAQMEKNQTIESQSSMLSLKMFCA